MTTEEIRDYEYELIDICIDNGYEQGDEDNGLITCEDVSEDKPAAEILYDAYGIPIGSSEEAYKMRQKIIVDFLRKWGEINSERKVLNKALGDYIFIKGISVIEAKVHSAKKYKSTCAVMIIDEVLANAMPVGRVPVKKGNKNQEPFLESGQPLIEKSSDKTAKKKKRSSHK